MADLSVFKLDNQVINIKDTTARTNASSAQTTANAAKSAAATAQTTANAAKTDAATAQTTANEAASGASNALSKIAEIEKLSRLEMSYVEADETITVVTVTH